MNNFEFYLPTKLIFGKGTQERCGELIAEFGSNVMIIYGSDRVIRNGLVPMIEAQMDARGIAHQRYGGIQQNPLLSTAEAICARIKEAGCDFLLAVGGGSVIDTAKAVSMGAVCEIPIWDFYEGTAAPVSALPFGVVLTMSATASEANGTSVIMNDQTGAKRTVIHPVTYPRFSVMNPELTYTVSAKQTAIGAIDVFAHAFERYFVRSEKGTLRRMLCSSIMKTVIWELPKAQQDPEDYESRSQLMWTACMAHNNMVGYGGVFACHAMSHVLTGHFGLPHGEALGILMPAWCKYLMLNHPKDMADFARDVWDVAQDSQPDIAVAQEGIFRFQHFICESGLPVTLREAGITGCNSKELAKELVGENEFIGEQFEKLYHSDLQQIFELCIG